MIINFVIIAYRGHIQLSFVENIQFVWSRIVVKGIRFTFTLMMPSNAVINVSSLDGDVTHIINANNSCRNATYMPIAPVEINNSDETVFAFLDTASGNAFCSRHLTEKLCIAGKRELLKISTIADIISTESKLIQLDVSSLDGNCINMSEIFVVDKISVKSSEVDVSMYGHLNDIEFSSLNGRFINWLR